MTFLPYWQSIDPPHVELLIVEEGVAPASVVQAPPRFCLRIVHGHKCRTKSGLLGEWARALSFPAYFDKNWDAFEECVTDLLWLPAPGYLALVSDAHDVLAEQLEEYPTFISILKEAGKTWATEQDVRPPIPFHVLLLVTERQQKRRKDWLVPTAPVPTSGSTPATTPKPSAKITTRRPR